MLVVETIDVAIVNLKTHKGSYVDGVRSTVEEFCYCLKFLII